MFDRGGKREQRTLLGPPEGATMYNGTPCRVDGHGSLRAECKQACHEAYIAWYLWGVCVRVLLV